MDNLEKKNNKLSRHEFELKNTLEGVKAYVQIRDKERSYVQKTITGAKGRIGVEEVAEIKKSKTPDDMKNKRYNAAIKLQYNRKTKEWNTKVLGRKEVLEKQLALLKELEASDLNLEQRREDIKEVRELIEKELNKRIEKAELKRAAKIEEAKKAEAERKAAEEARKAEEAAQKAEAERKAAEEARKAEEAAKKAEAERKAAEEAAKNAEPIPKMPRLEDVPGKDYKDFMDQEMITSEYLYYKTLMIKSYYGDKTYAKMYDEAIRRLTAKDKLIEKTKKYVDPATGKEKEIKYKAIKWYDEYENDTKITQLQEYAPRLERFNAFNAGDLSVYDNFEDKERAYEEDKKYIETYNNKYNSRKTTYENLKTLGNYGIKAEYKKANPDDKNGKKFLIGLGNTLKFVRNHTSAPFNKFIGTKIVAPLYKRNAEKNGKWEYPNPFENRPTHRYEKRKEYFRAKGCNAITCRLNSLFNYKEGNECTLAARGRELMYDANRKGIQEAKLNQRINRLSSYKELLSNYVTELTEKMNECTDAKKKVEYQLAIGNAKNKMKATQINRSFLIGLPQEDLIDFSAIDLETHKLRNRKNVTRVVTGVKMFARAGIRFTSVKLRDWLEANTQTTIIEDVPVERGGYYEQKEIEVLRYDGTDKSMDSFLAAKNGQTVQVYENAYPGAESVSYRISNDTVIRGVKADINGVDYSISDLGGVYTHSKVDNIADGFVGALKQTTDRADLNLSVEEIGKMITEGNQGDVFIAVSDSSRGIPRGWLKISREELQEHFSSTLISEKQTIQGDWIEKYTEMVPKETIKYNQRVINALNLLNRTRPVKNVISAAHLGDLAYENARDITEEDKNYAKMDEARRENEREENLKKYMRNMTRRRSTNFVEKYHFEESDRDIGGRVDKKGFNYNPRTGKFEGSVIKKSNNNRDER